MDKSGLGLGCVDGPSPSKKSFAVRKNNNKVEGVWITARDGLQVPVAQSGASAGEGGDSPTDDKDEMIWWSWDGKFVGFSDW